ncbi:hypothetical protein [Rhodanobacter sp. FW106-PBR-LB-2-11]|uniref:hypothetical protein n=1 Tax=Rhodanobacter sp. FW106-PBR-LB-2-11 TaxID=1524463 RepID=UPI0034E40E19
MLARRGVLVLGGKKALALAGSTTRCSTRPAPSTCRSWTTAGIRQPLRGDTPGTGAAAAGPARWPTSSHPLARALADAAHNGRCRCGAAACRREVSAGAGISGEVDGCLRAAAGADRAAGALAGAAAPAGLARRALVLADADGASPPSTSRRTTARRGPPPARRALRADGVAVAVASSDRDPLRGRAGERASRRRRPARAPVAGDKLARLQAARAEGRVTLAVGDGSNDAPVLAGADVSAALASGTGLAQTHADLLLLDGHLGSLADARAIARQVQRVTQQGRRWSLWYNLAAVPFAALGLVTPWLAAIGMSLSSLLVVLNALRVGGDEPGHAGSSGPALRPRELRA